MTASGGKAMKDSYGTYDGRKSEPPFDIVFVNPRDLDVLREENVRLTGLLKRVIEKLESGEWVTAQEGDELEADIEAETGGRP